MIKYLLLFTFIILCSNSFSQTELKLKEKSGFNNPYSSNTAFLKHNSNKAGPGMPPLFALVALVINPMLVIEDK